MRDETKPKAHCLFECCFSHNEDLRPIQELKEELLTDLQERLLDLQKDGFDEEAAFQRTISSIGEISELIESIHANTTKLQQIIGIDLCKICKNPILEEPASKIVR